ncbi:hypothetical protein WR25_07101 [Diploscapter pachys]|uniref:Chitin-binding type-2 domain-containing protein n=1 Tax=Diploscapter pachys TaxID=2018661 RepID=A0A2A2KVY2_9BILA|nr:hypothetical protein WR25_07101 [Diploscapter pachys]
MRRQIWKELFLTLLLAALTEAAYECNDDYTIFGEFCYKANNTEVNPFEALVQCSNEGGMVASIHSEEENNFVLGLFGESPPALAIIGLFSFSNHFSLWLDATYFNYNGFGLRNLTYGLCVAIAYESGVVNAGQWRSVKCLQSFHPFVCKKDATFTTEATEAPLTTPQLDITTQSHTTQSHTTVAHTTQGHSTEPSTTPGSGDFHGPSDCPNLTDGNYAMSACGNQFLTCSHGLPYVVDCPANLVYNWNVDQCDWPSNMGC